MRPSVLHAPDSMKAHWSVSGISSQPVSTGSSATARALQSTTNPETHTVSIETRDGEERWRS